MPIRELDWNRYLNKQVQIYRNLNNGRMSLRCRVNGSWKVVGHVTDCVLAAVTFRVSEKGRQRVIREETKNVHAWGSGTLLAEIDESIEAPIDLAYNPYKDTTFVQRGTKTPIVQCAYLVVRQNLVFVSVDAIQCPNPITVAETKTLSFPQLSLFPWYSQFRCA